jgi:hypothetical protein
MASRSVGHGRERDEAHSLPYNEAGLHFLRSLFTRSGTVSAQRRPGLSRIALRRNEAALKRILWAAALLALLIPVGIAQADAVQEFSYQIKDVKKDGQFTVVFSSRTYDSSGGIPPVLRENYQRIPAGSEIPKEFRNKKYYCNADKLLKDLQAAPESNIPFARRVDKLSATIKRTRSRLDAKAFKNATVCAGARIGEGTAQIDARPLFDELIPSVFYMFFGKAAQPGAVASIQILGMPDEKSAVVKKLPTTIQQTRVPLVLSFFSEPTEGKYGYKLVLPTGPIAGINISIAEVRAIVRGLTIVKKKKSCAKRKRGKCVKKKVKKTTKFWFTRPPCPPSGKLSFLSYYGYDDPQPDITKLVELPCPNFTG